MTRALPLALGLGAAVVASGCRGTETLEVAGVSREYRLETAGVRRATEADQAKMMADALSFFGQVYLEKTGAAPEGSDARH